MAEDKKDFFISYNGKDKDWAEWIAWELEATGYTVVIQAWDFRPGDNFVMKMQEAAVQANRTLMVLSPNYLAARFTQPEWTAAFVQDPTGEKGILLPVRVAECELQGLLPAIVHIDLFGLEEADAKKVLLAGISRGRAKPSVPPLFPSGRGQPSSQPPLFPESLRKIRNRIHLLLKQPRAASLFDELARQASAQSVEEMLVPQQADSLINSIDTLHKATERCLQRLMEEQKPDRFDSTKKVAKEIFGWLVLLAVDRDKVTSSGCAFDPWQGGIEVTIPLRTEAGTEVMVSSLGDRVSRFKLKYDNKNQPSGVAGQDSFSPDGLEDGIGQEDRLEGILKRIWVAVKKSVAPVPFDLEARDRLQAWLVGCERRREGHYYITVPADIPAPRWPIESYCNACCRRYRRCASSISVANRVEGSW